MVMHRATHSLHTSMSLRVYPTTVDFPVVPLDAWIRTTSRMGTASSLKGYCSRSSVLVVRGILEMSFSVRISDGFTPALTILS